MIRLFWQMNVMLGGLGEGLRRELEYAAHVVVDRYATDVPKSTPGQHLDAPLDVTKTHKKRERTR